MTTATDPGAKPCRLHIYAGCGESAWQPIETAPKDGSPFIAYGHGCRKIAYDPAKDWKPMMWVCKRILYTVDEDVSVGDGLFRKESKTHDLGWEGGVHSQPTHWMPLPDPPPG